MKPYRKGKSFATWVRRLEIHFRVNKVETGQKKDPEMFFLGGDYLFCAAEKLYSTEVALNIQQPGESASGFIFSILAEHCEFGEQKNRLVLDRILVGLSYTNLKHRSLT